MKWDPFKSMFNFQIKYIKGMDNAVVDALSPRPQISNLSISYHLEFSDMMKQYATNADFAAVWNNSKREVCILIIASMNGISRNI